MAAPKKFGRVGRIGAMILLTLSYFLVEIVVGHITSSIALVADSFHMLSDVVALIVGLAAVRISKMNSQKSTFGWVRAEVLGALVNTVFLLALCFTIFVDSVQRLIKTEVVDDPKLLLIVGSVGLGINLLGLLIFRDHAHGHSHGGGHSHGSKERKSLLEPDSGPTEAAAGMPSHELQLPVKSVAIAIQKNEVEDGACSRRSGPWSGSCSEDQSVDSASNSASNRQLNVVAGEQLPVATNGSSDAKETGKNKKKHGHSHSKKGPKASSQLNMRGIFLHVLGDALGSIVVIISALLIWLVPEGEGHINWKPYIDPVLSLVLVGIIVTTTIPLLKESALILLQAVPTQLSIQEMQKALEKMYGVLAVHELHVWQLAGSRHVASLHLGVGSLEDYVRLSSEIKTYFHNNGVHSVTIQPEFDVLHVKKEGRDCALECGPEKSCYTDTCCGKKATSSASAAAPAQQLLELIDRSEGAVVPSQEAGAIPTSASARSLEVQATGGIGGAGAPTASAQAEDCHHHRGH